MRLIRRTSQFKQDVKRMERRGKDMRLLKNVLSMLISGEVLAAQYHDHALVGQYRGSRECHIEPVWLLLYEATEDELILIRTGSHSDLFK